MLNKLVKAIGIGIVAIGLTACGGDGDVENEEEIGEESEVNTDEMVNFDDVPDIIATVNGEDIDKELYVATIKQQVEMLPAQGIGLESEEAQNFVTMLKEQLLEQLINEEVLVQAAAKEGIEVSEEEVEAEFDALVAQFESEEQLEAALEEQGVTMEEMRADIATFLKREKYIDAHTTMEAVDEAELQAAYDELIAMHGEDGEDVPTFDEYKDDLELQLQYEQKQEQLAELVQQLRDASEITIHM